MGNIPYTTTNIPVGFRTFSGGLNSTSNPLSLQDNELREVQNIDFDKFGSAVKRNGYTALNTSAFNSGAIWTSLHYLETSVLGDFLMGTCGNKLAKMDGLDGTWDDITGSLTITAGNANRFSWATFKDAAYGTNNVDVPIKWTGSGNGATWTVPTGLTKAKCTETWENYMFLANVEVSATRHATRLYWSCINEPEMWNDTDFNEIGFLDGQEIVCIKALGDRLVIFKERSIWLVFFTGSSDIPFVFHDTHSDVGAISAHSIQKVNNGLVFAYVDGIYFFDGNNAIKISDRINNTINNDFSASAFTNIISGYQQSKNRYWATYQTSSGSANDRVVTWDSFNNAFSIYKGIAANAITVLNNNGTEEIYFGDFDGFVYKADDSSTADDDPLNVTTAVDAFFRTKWYDYGDLVNVKGVPHAYIYHECSNSTLTFAYDYDLEEGDQNSVSFSTDCGGSKWDTAKWDTDTWGRTGGNLRRVDMIGRGRLISFKFANSTLAEDFQIHGLAKLAQLETKV